METDIISVMKKKENISYFLSLPQSACNFSQSSPDGFIPLFSAFSDVVDMTSSASSLKPARYSFSASG